MSPERLTELLKNQARQLGFGLVGSCPAVSPPGFGRLSEWIAAGYGGQMTYIPARLEAYAHPSGVLNGARSLLMLGCHYRTAEPQTPDAGQGRIARYAWGPGDYHDVLHQRLRQLRDFFQQQVPHALVRGVVDSAPLLEREFAQMAGLGWIGKNTMLINKHSGSWFFLAALITDQTLCYDQPYTADHCGTCRACLDACPTGAFPEPGTLDATRCLSYLTIELRGAVPAALRSGMRDWLFGCDICQQVCPWNRKAPLVDESAFQPAAESDPIELAALFQLTEDQFRHRFRRTALWRAKRRGLLRNAALMLGNQRPPDALDALIKGLNDPEPLVREACAWSLGRFDHPRAHQALNERQLTECDPDVQAEIHRALHSAPGAP
jgi:epoxyqueuosine reductase